MATRAVDVEARMEAAIDFLRGRIELTRVVLFGSQAANRAHRWSDIDLAVFSPDVAGMKFLEKVRLATDLQLSCGAELELHFFPASALTDAEPGSFVSHILETGKKVA